MSQRYLICTDCVSKVLANTTQNIGEQKTPASTKPHFFEPNWEEDDAIRWVFFEKIKLNKDFYVQEISNTRIDSSFFAGLCFCEYGER